MKTETRENKSQKTKRKGSVRRYKKSVRMICVVIFLLACTLTLGSYTLHAKNEEYKKQEKELREQIAKEERRAKEIEEYGEYVKTDDYIREIAEEKLNLVDPNEVIFKPQQ